MHLLVKHSQKTETQREGHGRFKLDGGRDGVKGSCGGKKGNAPMYSAEVGCWREGT